MPTLREVAAHAGVSVRTVSNVVNDFRYVAPETRARVQRALDELQYRPNLAARSLRGGRTGVVALVLPVLSAPYFSGLAAHFARAAAARDLTLVVEQTDGDPERERRLLAGPPGLTVDGIVYSPWALGVADVVDWAAAAPLVLLGEHGQRPHLDHVGIDDAAAAALATTVLLRSGRRRVAMVGASSATAGETARRRFEGYRRAHRDLGVRPDPALELPVDALQRDEGERVSASVLRAGARERPDALFCGNDELAIGAMAAAADAGLRVPQDVAVIGLDDIEEGRWVRPALTTVAPDTERIASRALDLLADRIEEASSGAPAGGATPAPPRHEVVPHRLVQRGSTDRADALDEAARRT